MNKMRLSMAMGVIALSLSGCTNSPKMINDTHLLSAAAEKILSEHVYHREIYDLCASLGGDNEIEAINMQQNWLNVNGKLIAAADAYYSQQQANNTITIQEKNISPSAIRLALNAQERARNELSLNKRSHTNQQKTCTFRLKAMNNNNLTLSNDPMIAKTQASLLSQPVLNHAPLQAPILAGGISHVSAGKSFFNINKQHKTQCAGAFTLVMVNNWPQEAYANFCGDKALEILTCDWGKCEAKKL